MSVKEIGRRLIAGVWVTDVADEGSGGGATDGASILGPFTVTYQSPDLTGNGFPLYTFPEGAVIWQVFFFFRTQFDPDNGMAVQDDTNTYGFYNSGGGSAPQNDGPLHYGYLDGASPGMFSQSQTVAAWTPAAAYTAGEMDIYFLCKLPS